VLSPNDANSSLSNIDFSYVGNSVSRDTSAFENIKRFSKSTNSNINRDTSDANFTFSKINNLYLGGSDILNNNTYNYGSYRQHNLSSGEALTPSYSTLVDKRGLSNFYSYNLGIESSGLGSATSKILSPDTVHNSNKVLNQPLSNTLTTQTKLNNLVGSNDIFFSKWLSYYLNNYNMNLADDVKDYANPFKTFFKFKNTKKLFLKNSDPSNKSQILDELCTSGGAGYYSWDLFNFSKSYRFKDIKSPNMQFLSPDKNLRSTVNKSASSSNISFNYDTNTGGIFNKNSLISSSLYDNYLGSESEWVDKSFMDKVLKTDLTFSNSHAPLPSNNPSWYNVGYDRVDANSKSETPSILSGKEELAPEYLFSPYWYSYYKGLSLRHSYSLILENMGKRSQFYLPQVLDYSEYDFRNNQAQEALEDAFWESSYSAFSHEDYVSIKKDSVQGSYFDKPRDLYNSTTRVSDKKSVGIDLSVPSSIVNVSLGMLTVLENSNLLAEPNARTVNTNFINNYYNFIKYNYSILFEKTFVKKTLLYANITSGGYYFNSSEIVHGSRSTPWLIIFNLVSDYQRGISGLYVSNIDNASNITGLNWDNFNFKGMGSDKYR